MKNLLYFLGILIPFLCAAQGHDTEIIPVSNHAENNVYYVDNALIPESNLIFNSENFGGIDIKHSEINVSELKRHSDKFWVWVSFGITSLAIVSLMLVFNKLKKNFNSSY